MKITTTKTTVTDLLILLENADPTEEVSFTRATTKAPSPCWCGCGGTTKSRFVPGHDSRFHGLAKKVARGQIDHADALINLPHDEARAEFDRHVVVERPLHEAREVEKAEKKAEREAEKAAKKTEHEAETTDADAEAAFFADIA